MFKLALDDERNKSYTPSKPWDDQVNSDPITDVNDAAFDFYTVYGLMPTSLEVTPQDHISLKNHPLIMDRMKHMGPSKGGLTPWKEILAAIFDVETYTVI